MKKFFPLVLFFLLLMVFPANISFAQANDADAANQYVVWIRRALDENRFNEAEAAIKRALVFSNVSSDISYLAAIIYIDAQTESRSKIVAYLDTAIDVNRWTYYSENEALVLKARQLVNMRRYPSALAALDQIREGDVSRDATVGILPLSADAAMLRLKAFRGIALNSLNTTEIAAFQRLVLSTMNRFSRDPRPAIIFLEYLNFIKRQNTRVRFVVSAGDQQILDLVIRRLPILVEINSELAWMAADFMQNDTDARRYIAGYRAGGFLENTAGFIPNLRSIPLALNYGLINDTQAAHELFNTPSSFYGIDFNALNDTFAMLRSEEGRDEFTRMLLNFTGKIFTYDSHNGLLESYADISAGVVRRLYVDITHEDTFNLQFTFNASGVPASAVIPASGLNAVVFWERYPFVMRVQLQFHPLQENFHFRPADFNFTPLSFIVLGGSRTRPGISYPVLTNQLEFSRRTLVSFCASINRLSTEFEGAIERIVLENGIPVQAVEILGTNIVSITEFEGGIPVIQYVDLDLDGRMETIRRFHRPGQNHPWPDPGENFNYRALIASSESDWTGEGRFKTGEVYLWDGSVVYLWDMDGTGTINYSETER
ncbi:MAG: hypothetical protein LBU88_10135 [Treponema sp.]|jgi:hypothetical protein|nr:hypothetical protein [Treponema sp.]